MPSYIRGHSNFAHKGAVLNYNPAKDADLNFWVKSRSGLSLVDSIAANNPALLLPSVTPVQGTAPHGGLRTGIIPDENTIVVMRGTGLTNDASYELADQRYSISNGYSGGYKFKLYWGNSSKLSTLSWNQNPSTFIIFNKKLWVLAVNIDVSDANIISIINTTAPTIDITTATWLMPATEIKLFVNIDFTAQIITTKSLTFIGNITSDVITWKKKYVFTNKLNIYDLLDSEKVYVKTNVGSIAANKLKKTYTAYGYDLLTNGQSLCYNAIDGVLSVPKLESGFISDANAPENYIILQNNEGDVIHHNLSDSIIRFPLGGLWDRNNTTIYETAATAAGTYYDATNVSDWHISELDNLLLSEWLKADYRGRWFVKITPNSVDIDERKTLVEILAYSVNKTGSDYNAVLKYVNDYNLIVI